MVNRFPTTRRPLVSAPGQPVNTLPIDPGGDPISTGGGSGILGGITPSPPIERSGDGSSTDGSSNSGWFGSILNLLGSLGNGNPELSAALLALLGIGEAGNISQQNKASTYNDALLNLFKQYSKMTPGEAVSGIQSFEQPMEQDMSNTIMKQVQAQMGERGFSGAPGIMGEATAEALAPYEMQQQELGSSNFWNLKNLPLGVPRPQFPMQDLSGIIAALAGGGGSKKPKPNISIGSGGGSATGNPNKSGMPGAPPNPGSPNYGDTGPSTSRQDGNGNTVYSNGNVVNNTTGVLTRPDGSQYMPDGNGGYVLIQGPGPGSDPNNPFTDPTTGESIDPTTGLPIDPTGGGDSSSGDPNADGSTWGDGLGGSDGSGNSSGDGSTWGDGLSWGSGSDSGYDGGGGSGSNGGYGSSGSDNSGYGGGDSSGSGDSGPFSLDDPWSTVW